MASLIVQAVPEQFLIDQFLEEYALSHLHEPDWWVVCQKHEVQPGDQLFVWKGPSEPPRRDWRGYFSWKESIGRAGKDSGIFARGFVLDKPHPFQNSIWEQEKYQKYRVKRDTNFTSNNRVVNCIYGDPKNIRVRNPLLEDTLKIKLENKVSPKLHTFLFQGIRRKRYSIALNDIEAEIINSLFNDPE